MSPIPTPKRPRLTAAVVAGLRQVSRECELNVDERLGCDQPIGNEDACYRAMEYLDALIAWYEATHP